MKRSGLIGLLLCAGSISGQQNGVRVYFNAIEIQFETRLEPSSAAAEHFPGGVGVDKPEGQPPTRMRVHRTISDKGHQRSFGYDLVLESMPDPQTIRMRIEPLRGVTANPGETLLAPARVPTIPVVHIGETVALDLLINPATGQRLVDYLKVEARGAPGSEGPRDFALSDVELRLHHPHIQVNGKPIGVSDKELGTTTISAHILWLGLPRAGSFEISLWPEPRLGFQKAGTVDENVMSFRVGSVDYRVESDVPFVTGSGVYNVYVRHDPAWKGGFVIAGSDRVGMLHIE